MPQTRSLRGADRYRVNTTLFLGCHSERSHCKAHFSMLCMAGQGKLSCIGQNVISQQEAKILAFADSQMQVNVFQNESHLCAVKRSHSFGCSLFTLFYFQVAGAAVTLWNCSSLSDLAIFSRTRLCLTQASVMLHLSLCSCLKSAFVMLKISPRENGRNLKGIDNSMLTYPIDDLWEVWSQSSL